MHGRAPPRGIVAAAALLCGLIGATPRTGDAQPAGLRRRMDAFAAALREGEAMDSIAKFFPRRAAWELVRTPDRVAPGATIDRRRFGPESTLRAIRAGGPVCESFGGVVGDVGPAGGVLVSEAMYAKRRWRYVGRRHFVPPGGTAASPVFVEWSRENGVWVISRAGELYGYSPRVIGEPTEPHVTRDTTAGRGLPPERRFAVSARWFRDGTHVGDLEYGRYLKHGQPRVLTDDLVERFGSIGVVPVFVERGRARGAEVLYVLTGPGEYQPYVNFFHSTCRS